MTVEVCRTCVSSCDLSPLFPPELPYETIRNDLQICTGLKIEKNDSLPQSICKLCESALRAAVQFRNQSQAAERKIVEQFKNQIKTKRICFNDNRHLKLLTEVKRERDHEDQVKTENEDEENLIVHFPNNVYEVATVTRIDDLLDTLLSVLENGKEVSDLIITNAILALESVARKSDQKLESGVPRLKNKTSTPIEKLKFEKTHDAFDDVAYFQDADDFGVEDASLSEAPQAKKIKPKLTRLDLIDGAPNRCGPNKCRLCKKVSPNLKAFYKHLNSKHFGIKKAILCEFCAMSFTDNQKLLRHCRARHGLERDNSFPCSYCPYRALDKEQLDFCAMSFTDNQKLLRHCRARHGLERDNSFPCSYCPYRALDKEQLDVHERRTHTKERPFVCDNCGAGFFSKRVLIQHSRNHTDDKPYQCDKCPSKFKTRQRLCGHNIKIHVRRFTYACPACDKRLSKSPYIRRHLLKEHGVPLDRQGELTKVYLDR